MPGSTDPTPVLDWKSPLLRELTAGIDSPTPIGISTRVSAIFETAGGPDASSGFTNSDNETLFDAIARTTVDGDGETSSLEECSACDLSAEVVGDLGQFNARDDLFALHGQTLWWGVRKLANTVLSRWSAGAAS